MRILVVDDDASYSEALGAALRREGFQVDLAPDGRSGLEALSATAPDLVLLDMKLPDTSGSELFRSIRDRSSVPIILVTALNGELDVVLGLELGAADYVTKPFHLRELVARIQAVLRRISPPKINVTNGSERSVKVDPQPDVVVVGPVEVDFARREVMVSDKVVHLSRREFDLLSVLLNPPGRVRTRDELIDRLWSGRDLVDTRTLDTHVRRLRMKLQGDSSSSGFLVTVRGVGFRLDVEGWEQKSVSV